jgi:tetratricopeptide (TPR) repeat protein
MDTKVRTILKSAMLLAAGVLAFPCHLISQEQEECEFEGSEGADAAQTAFERITATSTEDEIAAANQEALDALSRELGGDNPIVFLFASQASIGVGNFDEASRYLARYDEVAAPQCAQYGDDQRYSGWVRLYNAGVSTYGAGQNEEALKIFLLANEFQPNLISFSNAAQLQIELGDNAGAMETYQTALAADIPDADPDQMRNVIRGLGNLLSAEGRSEEALDAYRNYMTTNPGDVVIQIGYAGLLAEQGEEEESQTIYDGILERSDLSSAQWVEVGVGLYNSENYGDAATAFGKARANNPFHKEGMENFVNASVQAGRPGPVVALADTLVKWYPYDAANYQLLASALARADMEDRAMAVIGEGQATDLVFHFVQMAPSGDGAYVVQGSFEARNATGMLAIPFEFLDVTGGVVQTETLSVEAPSAGQPETFRLEIQTGVPLAGFRYKKIGT